MPLQGGYPGRPGPHPAPSGLEIGLAGGPADHFSRSPLPLSSLFSLLLSASLFFSLLLSSSLLSSLFSILSLSSLFFCLLLSSSLFFSLLDAGRSSHCNLLAPCLLASGLLASGLLASGLDALRITADTSAVLDAAFYAVFHPCLQKGHSLRSRTGATT